jgi:hypothetical protein
MSIFLPWSSGGYVVADLPEAIFSNLGLIYLAHTHVPTLWDAQGISLAKVEWKPDRESWTAERELPNRIRFGSRVTPAADHVTMEMWLHNGTAAKLSGLRSQVCMHLKGAVGFHHQGGLRRVESMPFIAIRAADEEKWIIVSWNPCQRVWGNPPVPCIHSDPIFPDCLPGETVRVAGKCWFYEGDGIEQKLDELRAAIGE